MNPSANRVKRDWHTLLTFHTAQVLSQRRPKGELIMLHINRLFTILLLLALILSACEPIQPPVMQSAPAAPAVEQNIAAPAEAHGLRPDAPAFAIHGPFAVGYRPLVIGEGTDHPLDAGLWYPALNPNGAKEEVVYTIKLKIPMEQPDMPALVNGHALLDAKIDVAAAPYPLVVFSHGFSTNAAWYSNIIEHYASYGFIVLAPEHVEHFDFEWSELWSASIDRPRDIKETLDYAEQMNSSSGEMAGLIDMQHVAVAGHSYGGYTALAMAGAQYDLAAYNARCAQLPADDPNAFLCAPIVPKEAEMAARAGLDPMTEGLWPSFGDPRVTAIIPMAGDSYLFDKTGLSKITVPMIAIGGTADTGTPYDWGSKPSYDNVSSTKKALVTLEGAEHAITTSCEGMPWMSETPFYQWICFDPVWDKDRGLDLINHFSTAFLLAELKGDADAATALAAENVSFPGVQYQETGYGEPSEISAAAEPQPPQGLRFDAPEYAIDGPYTVGVRYVNIPAATEGDRDLIATVWYPAQKSNGALAEMVYEQQFAPGEIPAFTVLGHAQLDAPPDASGAPYPLVVYSHAHWSFGQETAYLTEHLASRGFVVISADHQDNWSTAFGPLDFQAMIRRPQEVTRQIDYAESLTAADGSLPGMIDTTGVGVAGWSMGGETALAVAGARWDINSMRAWCTENPDGAALNEWACIDILEKEAEMATFAGLAETPKGLWPSVLDERIHAAISLAGPTNIFGSEGIQSIHVPVMFLVGSGETSVDPAFEMAKPYESISSEHKAKVVLDHSEHMVFFSSCADSPSVAALGFPMFCTDPVWDMDRAHDLINHFATAFLLAELKGDSVAAAALAAENVNFSGVQYEATGY
jgi:predicted dienelactone hydrolase